MAEGKILLISWHKRDDWIKNRLGRYELKGDLKIKLISGLVVALRKKPSGSNWESDHVVHKNWHTLRGFLIIKMIRF